MRTRTAQEHAATPRIIADLLQPEAYDHPADDLRLHETHSSWVVLAGAYAYKLKKPVNLGFLDFTNVEARRADCEEELRLNRRFSPDMYLGVVEIVEDGGRFRVGGPAGSGEPAVWMRRLPEAGMLPELLAQDAVDARLARRIGRTIAAFHARAATGRGIDEFGSRATVRANWQENFDQMAPFVGRTIDAELNEHIRNFVERFLKEHAALLDRRVAEKRIRDGHGDLHAASICIDAGRIQLFDSLQFAPRFRCADVAAEVGFLAMDLEHYGHADLAWAFVEAYVRSSGDTELPALLDFYACYRAYVRGKVRTLRLAQTADTEEQKRIIAESRAYFDLAWAHAGGFTRPRLVVSMGLPASGKTTLAEGLARHLGMVHVSSDRVRKAMAGLPATKRSADSFGQGLYAANMTQRTYAALRRNAALWIRRGRAVVLDATYGDRTERARVLSLARRLDVELLVLLCHAGEDTVRARLLGRASQQGVVSDARLELWPQLRAAFTEPNELVDLVKVDATHTPQHTLEQALAVLRETGRRPHRSTLVEDTGNHHGRHHPRPTGRKR